MTALSSNTETIVALATPQGVGAIGVIRLSGPATFAICQQCFANKALVSKDLSKEAGNTIHFGVIHKGEIILDEVLVSVFKAPHSYTGENTVEISCHGSPYIQQQIIHLLISLGARLANQGEYTMRAFLNGKLDLSQAEAVADVIASNSSVSHQIAIQQMRGGFSNKIQLLRQNLIDFASLIELELDFSEEDVEFADRKDLKDLVNKIQRIVQNLIKSFEVGNVIKNGIPVAIVGKPNVGKSTLLNALLDDEKAIVSDVPGTTRDVIEDEINIDGVMFRVIDTAGIRDTSDKVEAIGVQRTFDNIKKSSITLYVFDVHEITSAELRLLIDEITPQLNGSELVIIGNKIDHEDMDYTQEEFKDFPNTIFVSAKAGTNLPVLKNKLIELFDKQALNVTETVVTNARHVEALHHTNSALTKVLDGLTHNISGDFLAMDIRNALHHLGLITGDVSTDDLLENIFSRFCIGK